MIPVILFFGRNVCMYILLQKLQESCGNWEKSRLSFIDLTGGSSVVAVERVEMEVFQRKKQEHGKFYYDIELTNTTMC